MRLRLTCVLNLDSGDYAVDVQNLSNPGEGVPLLQLRAVLDRVLDDLERRARQGEGKPGDDDKEKRPRRGRQANLH